MSLTAVNEANFDEEVKLAKVPVLVDFWAEWCGPCRMLTPVLEQLAEEKGAAVKITKVNVDENPGLAQEFSVRSIPMLAFFHEGRVEGHDCRDSTEGSDRGDPGRSQSLGHGSVTGLLIASLCGRDF